MSQILDGESIRSNILQMMMIGVELDSKPFWVVHPKKLSAYGDAGRKGGGERRNEVHVWGYDLSKVLGGCLVGCIIGEADFGKADDFWRSVVLEPAAVLASCMLLSVLFTGVFFSEFKDRLSLEFSLAETSFWSPC
ncbi:hypothetical protein ACJX0J_008713 [Zea mays]